MEDKFVKVTTINLTPGELNAIKTIEDKTRSKLTYIGIFRLGLEELKQKFDVE